MSGPCSGPYRLPWRWLLMLAAVILLVGVLPALTLAQWGPYLLGRALSAYLQTSVTVQGVTGGWWNGVTVRQLTVAEDPTPQAPTLVRVEQVTVNLSVVSLLLSSKPIALHLDAVHIDLRRRQDAEWNLTPLLKALGTGTLGQRQPHLTHVALTCTLWMPPPFTHLSTEACRLHAAEAQLSLRGSTVDLDPEPKLTLHVDGSLAGSLIGALVPEVPGQFPDPVRVDGQLTLPFRGAVWHAMGWRLAVTSDRFVFDDTFTEVHTTVVKSVDQLEITDLRARRGTGRIDGAGAWRLAEPVDGGLQVQLDHLPFGQSLAPWAAGGPWTQHHRGRGGLCGAQGCTVLQAGPSW